jgi:predicted nuclease of predicted toxin-antitoxin system
LRFLVDACAGGSLARALREDGHDVLDLLENGGLDEGDEEVLRRAWEERRVLITIDKDFGELIFLHGQPHAGMIRLPDCPAAERLAVLRRILPAHVHDLDRGAIIIVRGERVRVTRFLDR